MPNNIRELRNRAGLTMRGLADRMGIHHTTIAKIERSERNLTLDWMERFAEALGVGVRELIGDAPETPQLRMVPLVGKIAAGNWREAIEEPIGMVPALGGGPRTFGLQPDGDSMDRAIMPGAYVLVDPDQVALLDGKIYAVQNGDGDATIKRFRADPPRLVPESSNPEHQPILLGTLPFTVVGRVIFQVAPT